jgi:branched-chain amino acid transport system ATP-binding protein
MLGKDVRMTSTPGPAPGGGSDESVLRLDGVGLSINSVRIVQDVSLAVAAGEFVAIIGPNGAGKTSLFNLISGTTRLTAGRIELFGRDVSRASVHARARRGLGRTFQASYLLPGLTVLENVRMQSQAVDVKGVGLLRRVSQLDPTLTDAREALDRVGLGHRQGARAEDLSHGDRRKLEIAIVLASRAGLILFDEPMAGVNADDVDELVALIRSVNREDGKSVLMVEHHMEVVLGLADRVAVMHHGALLAIDEPDAVMTNATVQQAYVGDAL